MASIYDALDWLSEKILMLHRRHRVMDPHHFTHFIHAVATGIHDDLTVDVAFLGVDSPSIIFVLRQAGNGAVPIHLRACFAGPSGKRLAELRGVNIAIERIPQAAHKVICRDQGMSAGAFVRIDHLKMHVHAPRHGGKMPIAVHLGIRIGQPYAAIAVMVVDRILRIIRQLFVKIYRMGFQPDHRLVHAEIRDLRCRVPCRARGQLIAFHQNHIGPTLLREVIQRGTSGNTATDHHAPCLRLHGLTPECMVSKGGFLARWSMTRMAQLLFS